MQAKLIEGPSGPIYWTGPDLEEGPLPAFFYFALAGDESLELDPFNQPVVLLQETPIRVFSMTIPGHGPGFDKVKAINLLAENVASGLNPIEDFVLSVIEAVEYLEPHLIPGKIAAGGLSRGAFVATHLAAKEKKISHILGFAPMSSPSYHKEFKDIKDSPITQSLELESLIPSVFDRKIRFYIGNRDLRVSTKRCFQFVEKLADYAYEKGIRSSPIELILGPSVGHMGHGTLPPIFKNGIDWLIKEFT